MEFSFLDMIGIAYDDGELDCLNGEHAVPECKKFIEEHTMDMDTEEEFLNVVYEQATKSFKHGFRACMQMMLECASTRR